MSPNFLVSPFLSLVLALSFSLHTEAAFRPYARISEMKSDLASISDTFMLRSSSVHMRLEATAKERAHSLEWRTAFEEAVRSPAMKYEDKPVLISLLIRYFEIPIAQWMEDKDVKIVYATVFAIKENAYTLIPPTLSDEAREELKTVLINATKHADKSIRETALDILILKFRRDREAQTAFRNVALTDRKVSLKTKAIDALSYSNSPDALDLEAIALLCSVDQKEVLAAARIAAAKLSAKSETLLQITLSLIEMNPTPKGVVEAYVEGSGGEIFDKLANDPRLQKAAAIGFLKRFGSPTHIVASAELSVKNPKDLEKLNRVLRARSLIGLSNNDSLFAKSISGAVLAKINAKELELELAVENSSNEDTVRLRQLAWVAQGWRDTNGSKKHPEQRKLILNLLKDITGRGIVIEPVVTQSCPESLVEKDESHSEPL